ncbi:hypothetical protein [Mycobacterium barrassiae]|uniref:hypothetical protein n=1 Tax=Mycobacterium barrassiae TaxID=319709 RepID=UPI002265D089|nr:hypothetical protein [Mycobacterium barrassiae]
MLALLVVIGVTAAVTISVTKDRSEGSTPNGETFGLASADDKGPANIITEDPSCAAWSPIAQTFVDVQDGASWGDRDPDVAASDWTPEQRAQFEQVGRAARNAADQTVDVAKLTPHRVMRELYEQYIAYARAYSDSIATYTPADDHMARVFTSIGSAIAHVCSAIKYGSAASRGPLIPPTGQPSNVPPLQDPNSPIRFMRSIDPVCADWTRLLDKFALDTTDWQELDPALPASKWNASQRAVADAAIPIMKTLADDIEELGQSSANVVFREFALFAAQYRRAYAQALPSYTAADSYLSGVSSSTTSAIWEACKAVGG